MPLNMPPNLTSLKNQLSQPGAWVWLLTIALPNGGPTLRYASNTQDVVYGGQTYRAFSFHIDGFALNSDGEIPELTMRVTNVGYAIQEYVRAYGGLVGGVVSYVQVNTDFLAEDYSEDLISLTIVGAVMTWPDVELTLSVPPALRYRVPEDRYNPHACRHAFRTPSGEYTTRCGYTGQSIVGVALPSGGPVSIEATGHGFVTGEKARVFDVEGITGGLEGDYTVTVVDADHVTLDGTDGGEYGGSFVSGRIGFAYCERTPAACARRGRFPANYGGPLSLRREAVRYA